MTMIYSESLLFTQIDFNPIMDKLPRDPVKCEIELPIHSQN